jgi:outer membrane usher protein
MRAVLILLLVGLAVGFLLLRTARAADGGDTVAVLQLTVNGVDKGAVRVLLRGASILIPVAALKQAGFATVPAPVQTVGGEAYVVASDLAPKVKVRYDETNLVLALEADPALLAATSVNLGQGAPPGIEYVTGNSAFVNYALTASTTTNPSFLTEQGYSFDGKFFDDNLAVDPTGRVDRLGTSLSIDDRAALTRLTFGDALANGGTLGGTANIAGISYGTNFGINPYFTPFPNQRFAGTVATPSTADIYVNGVLVRSVNLAPGPFNLQNLPAISGAGETRVVIRNAYGQTQELGAPYYLSTQLLQQGLSNFSYTVGAERAPFDNGFGTYTSPALMAYHQYGVTDWLSPGVFVAADNHRAAGGPQLTLGTPLGTLAFYGALSDEDGLEGQSASAQYSYQAATFSVGASATYTSRDYATLDLDVSQDREIGVVDAFVGVPLGTRNNLTLNLSDGFFRDAGHSDQVSLTDSVTLTERLDMAVTVSHADARGAPNDNGIFLSLTIALGPDTTGTASVNHDRLGTVSTAQVEKSVPLGEGYGYIGQLATGPQSEDVADVQYQGTYGRYEVDAQRIAGVSTGTATISGALVDIGDHVMATRPIQDAYGLVRVPGVAGVSTTLSNQEIGKTDADGDLMIPNLQSYYGNQVGINDKDIGIDYSVGATQRIIAPAYRGGAIVDFPVHRLQALQGRLVIVTGGKETVPAYGELTVQVAGKPVTSPIDEQGAFYLESLAPNSYPASIAFQGSTCRFTIAIPKKLERSVDLGTLACRAAP